MIGSQCAAGVSLASGDRNVGVQLLPAYVVISNYYRGTKLSGPNMVGKKNVKIGEYIPVGFYLDRRS